MREGKTSTSSRTEGYGIKDLVSPVWCLQHQLTADTEGEPKKTVPPLQLTPPPCSQPSKICVLGTSLSILETF